MILHEVITPENVPFTYRVAGLGSRFLAWLVDMGFIALLCLVGLILRGALDLGRLVVVEEKKDVAMVPGVGEALFLVWAFVVVWGYFVLFEWLWLGQTPGKK